MLEPGEGQLVGPLQIVEDQDDRQILGQVAKRVGQALPEPTARVAARKRHFFLVNGSRQCREFRFVKGEDARGSGHDPSRAGCAKHATAVGDGLQWPEQAFQWSPARGQTLSAEDLMLAIGHSAKELQHEPGFADPAFTAEQREPPATAPQPRRDAGQVVEQA